MDEALIPGAGDVLSDVWARFGAPAYVRRARQVEEAFESLLRQCRARRDESVKMVRIRLGLLHALSGGWVGLRPLLEHDEDVDLLRRLYAELQPRLRDAVPAAASRRVLRLALTELCQSIERFNRGWRAYLAAVDLGGINALRDGYNRYYLLEKECALRSPRLARQGYRPLSPMTAAELQLLLPPMTAPRIAAH